jgi:hypothetical protein
MIPILSHEIGSLKDGTEVIVETKRWDAKTGYPRDSIYYRAIIGHHMTVAGIAVDMKSEPNWEFPLIPPWQCPIYAQNTGTMQLWKRSEK